MKHVLVIECRWPLLLEPPIRLTFCIIGNWSSLAMVRVERPVCLASSPWVTSPKYDSLSCLY